MATKSSALSPHTCDEVLSPLELFNLYYSDGQTTGNRQNKVWQRMNKILSWENIVNHDYQSDLCALLYFIMYKYFSSDKLLLNSNSVFNIRSIYKTKDFLKKFRMNLKNQYNATLLRNLILFNEIDTIKEHFNRAGIKYLFLKGADYTEKVYNIALRPMSDIDILIHHEYLSDAVKLLKGLGYHQDLFHGNEKHDIFIKYSNNNCIIPVELHKDIVSQQLILPLNLREVWSRSHNHSMNICHSINYLCYHWTYHRFDRVIWIFDFAFLCKAFNGSIHWPYLYDTARNWKLDYVVHFIILILNDIFPSIEAYVESNVEYRLLLRLALAKSIFLRLQNQLSGSRNIKLTKHLLRLALLPHILDVLKYSAQKTLHPIS